MIEHGGGIPGFSTYALRLPDDRVYVAVLCNSDAPEATPSYLARRIAAVAIGNPFPEPVAIQVDPKGLQRYVGVYQLLAAMGLLSVEHLNLGVPTYDPAMYYNAVKNAPVTSPQGKKLQRILDRIDD